MFHEFFSQITFRTTFHYVRAKIAARSMKSEVGLQQINKFEAKY